MDLVANLKMGERKLLQGIFAALALLVVVLSLFGDKGLLQLQSLKDQEAALQSELHQLQREQDIWLARLKALQKGESYFETLARQELGYVKKGEVIIRIIE